MAAHINPSGLLRTVATSPSSIALFLTVALCLILLTAAIRRLFFHPLTSFPGPPLWSLTRIPYAISLLCGTLNTNMLAFHAQYGPVIRIAPNELSFACEEAWK